MVTVGAYVAVHHSSIVSSVLLFQRMQEWTKKQHSPGNTSKKMGWLHNDIRIIAIYIQLYIYIYIQQYWPQGSLPQNLVHPQLVTTSRNIRMQVSKAPKATVKMIAGRKGILGFTTGLGKLVIRKGLGDFYPILPNTSWGLIFWDSLGRFWGSIVWVAFLEGFVFGFWCLKGRKLKPKRSKRCVSFERRLNLAGANC